MIRKFAPTTFVLLLLAGCATPGPTVKVDHDPTADMSGFRTYAWAFNSAPRGMNPLLYQRVRSSIDTYLAGRGFTQADSPDFAVGFTLGKRERVEVTDWGPYGAGWGVRGGWGWGYSNVDVRNITEGTLAIDIFDARTKQAVWHGTATQNLSSSSGATQATIDTAVSSVLSQFPPQAAR